MKNAQSNAEGKKFVGAQAAQLIQDGMVVGMGTGSTIACLIEELARRVREEGIKFVAVPTSFQSRILCMKLGIPVRDMQDTASVDLAIDGADEVDPDLNLIKGGGASHTPKRSWRPWPRNSWSWSMNPSWLVGWAAPSPFPSRCCPRRAATSNAPSAIWAGSRRCAWPCARTDPVVTDNGELVFDVRFAPTADLRAVDKNLHNIPGIIETGLFFDMTGKVLVGCGEPGSLSLKTLSRKP
jgi:ribose 5-phosphate isomerase A